MFRPLEMVRVVLQVLHSDAAKVTHVIAKQGLFHLLDSRQFAKFAGQAKVGGEAFQSLVSRFSALDQELQNMFHTLSIHRTLRKDIEIEPTKEIDAIEDSVKRIRRDLSNLSGQLEQLEQQREEKAQQVELLRSIAANAPDLETIRKFTYFYRAIGFIASKDIPRFEASLESIHVVLVPLTTIERRTLITVLCSPKDKDVLERALKSAYVERIILPDIGQGSLDEVITQLDADLNNIAVKKSQLSRDLQNTQADVVEELQKLREKVSLALLILKAEVFYGKGTRSYVILGWIPKVQIETFKQEIMKVTEGRARFDVSEPELIEEVQQGKIKIPILFNNPLLIKPFESVVFNYGTQDYREIDPTPIVAITFLLMFGMMFGDVGHGIVLFALGYWVFKRFYQFMDYGIITMECGVSSVIFGLLYGSIFGVEHWLPALWLHPAENIGSLIKFAIGLGVVMISAAVILNIINSFHRKDYASGILGHYGIVGGLFYWITIGLGLKYAIYGNLGVSTEVLILFLAVPLGIIFFREPLSYLLFKHEGTEEKLFPEGIAMFVMESVIDVMDVVIRYLASTVSFVRTAAFALAHGGLFIAVFSLADILAQMKGGGLWYWLAIILGNVLIIALEGLVVSIQTIRLEYYEFFSKFFKGGGERFQPLKVE
ncbi:H(+)-transporting two-sector ATPase [Candidatus Vecturithrix granuli]|uniref:H(+)-transporting two-sector ATPase n=1 Tax=Vecturithrix granuli TaxID=1499967 RepID=A0A0S6W989_VECG1|nr:H(+)-transporting two-sector ATPase [Candidatus Vecturithrix granuli]